MIAPSSKVDVGMNCPYFGKSGPQTCLHTFNFVVANIYKFYKTFINEISRYFASLRSSKLQLRMITVCLQFREGFADVVFLLTAEANG